MDSQFKQRIADALDPPNLNKMLLEKLINVKKDFHKDLTLDDVLDVAKRFTWHYMSRADQVRLLSYCFTYQEALEMLTTTRVREEDLPKNEEEYENLMKYRWEPPF